MLSFVETKPLMMKKKSAILCAFLISTLTFGQSTWYQIFSGTTKKLNAIDFPNDSAGYIAGNDSTLLFSWNDGATWTQMSLNGISFSNGNDDIIDVEFFNTGDGYIVIDQGGVYKTTNSGLNWTPVTGQTSNMCFPNTLFLFNMGKFLVGGEGCFEGAIIDQFENSAWSTANLGMNFWNSEHVVQEMSFISFTSGLAATKSEYILKTIDGGYNWDTIGIRSQLEFLDS